MRHDELLQNGDEEARKVATTDDATKQLTELSRETSKQDLISTGQEPLVSDDDLKASQRNVLGLSAGGTGFQWH
jgi:hypothetical protein